MHTVHTYIRITYYTDKANVCAYSYVLYVHYTYVCIIYVYEYRIMEICMY